MSRNRITRSALLSAVMTTAVCVSQAQAAIVLTGPNPSNTQNFDSLSSTSWTNDVTLPGWSLFRQPAPGTAITSIALGSGSSNAGSFYSFSGSPTTDRALGGVGSGGTYFGSPATGSLAGWIAVSYTNGTGLLIDQFTIEYDGEQWRNGGNTSVQTMVLQYGYGSSFSSVASWTTPGGNFNFTSPVASSSQAALDGNAAANRAADRGGSVAANWAAGDTLWIRWVENNDSGNDHGLAVDNFSLVTRTVPEPATLALLALGGLTAITRRRG